jgi:hypothetical protein
MRNGCAVVFLLATLSPGVMILLAMITGNADQPLRVGDWCALGWVAIVVASVLWGLVPGLSSAEREWRRRRGRCLECGYDLRATPGRCPECGAEHGKSDSISS